VEVRIESPADGKVSEKVVNRYFPGDCFGEQALLTKGKRIASCVATKPCVV
jgi:CRP-like cAMP-binding protein